MEVAEYFAFQTTPLAEVVLIRYFRRMFTGQTEWNGR
jgi:hypothetical protein